MKIRYRLIFSYSILTFIICCFCYFGNDSMSKMNESSQKTFLDKYPKVIWCYQIDEQLNIAARSFRNAILTDDNKIVSEQITRSIKTSDTINILIDSLNAHVKSGTGKILFNKLLTALPAYKESKDKLLGLIKTNKNKDALDFLFGDMRKTQNALFDAIGELLRHQNDSFKETATNTETVFIASRNENYLYASLAFLFAVFIGIWITRSIMKPVNQALDAANGISRGNLDVNLESKSKDEFGNLIRAMKTMTDKIKNMVEDTDLLAHAAADGNLSKRADADKHEGEYKKIISGFNLALDNIVNPLNMAADYLEKISDGNIPPRISEDLKGDFGKIVKSLNHSIYAINLLVTDAKFLAKSAAEGNLAARADESQHRGEFREIIEGVNQTLHHVIAPLNVTASYLENISKGKIPPKITKEYKGDFNAMKNHLNTCIDAINSLVTDANKLAVDAQYGKLRSRVDVSGHQGDFRLIIEGVNRTLDSMVRLIDNLPIPAMAIDTEYNIVYMNEIGASLGNVKASSLENTKCFDFFKTSDCKTDNCACFKSMKINNAANSSTDAHPGNYNLDIDYSAIPINDENNNVIGAFEVVMDQTAIRATLKKAEKISEYQASEADNLVKTLEKVSKGDLSISLKTADSDNDTKDSAKLFSHIYSAVDSTVSSIKSLAIDVNTLIVSASDGQLSTRADANKHLGEYRRIIEGINQTLDAVINPLNMAADYVAQISKGNIPAKITDEYKGDFNILKNNLNICIDAINALVSDSMMLAKYAADGKLDTRADSSKHGGDFRAIIEGVNQTLDNVIGPLNMAAEYVDRISKGDIPTKISASYKGDFNEIKNNLNTCIDAINLLVNDTALLVDSAIEGKLDYRAETIRHNGEFRKIIDGFNQTLNAVIDPINEARNVLSIMATGDLTAQMQGYYQGDHKKLVDSINSLAYSLSHLIAQVLESASTSAMAAGEISQAAESMAAASAEQSAQADDVATAVEEMSRTVTENAFSAGKTADVANKNRQIATEGGTVVSQTIDKMKDIAEVVKTSAANIQKLGESSKQIGEIISVINDIADQTNLLALNAAIEAARAGEQGRGFAVVADEVRKLAERTTNATKQISSMIKSIQSETYQSVEFMTKGNLEVNKGIKLADSAGAALKEIVGSSQDLLDMINQIAAASEQQSSTSEQISKNVVAISKVSSDSTKQIEEIAHAAEDLTELTVNLQKVVQQFKIEVDTDVNNSFMLSSARKELSKDNKKLTSGRRSNF
ncbi:MAG: methyl-accepting chemotaxis protein [Candidatus Kapabacteria bacterium]|nr:methyl-accepting chemotaxis protein [Candidatus Kapabacteria bacterium]